MNRYFPILIIGLLTAHVQPSFAMQKDFFADEENYDNECAICFEDKSSAETLKLRNCPHSFHIHCLRDWASNAQHPRNCALCRTNWTWHDIQLIQDNRPEKPSGLPASISTKNPHYALWAVIAVPVVASIVYGSYKLYTYLHKRKEEPSQPAKRVPQKTVHKRRIKR